LKEYRDANVDEDSNIASYFREKAIRVKESGEKGTNVSYCMSTCSKGDWVLHDRYFY